MKIATWFAALLLFTAGAKAQAPEPAAAAPTPAPVAGKPTALRIAPFQGDRVAAISYTFDDGKLDTAEVVLPMFEKRSLRMTFFIIVSITPETDAEALAKPITAHGRISWESLRKFAARGHEVANHSWSHQGFVNGPDEGFALQIDAAHQLMSEKMGAAPLTYCFPGNGYNKKALEWVLRKHIAARTQQFEIGKETLTAALANEWADSLIADKKWGVTMGHSITQGGFRLSSPDVLADHLDYVKSREKQIWVDTFANVSLYTQEQKVAKAVASDWAENAVTITVSCPLEPTIFKHPLTVVLPIAGAKKPRIQTGTVDETAGSGTAANLPLVVREQDILIDLVPDGTPVRVSWE